MSRRKGAWAPAGQVHLAFGLFEPLGTGMAKGRPEGATQRTQRVGRLAAPKETFRSPRDKREETFLRPKRGPKKEPCAKMLWAPVLQYHRNRSPATHSSSPPAIAVITLTFRAARGKLRGRLSEALPSPRMRRALQHGHRSLGPPLSTCLSSGCLVPARQNPIRTDVYLSQGRCQGSHCSSRPSGFQEPTLSILG